MRGEYALIAVALRRVAKNLEDMPDLDPIAYLRAAADLMEERV